MISGFIAPSVAKYLMTSIQIFPMCDFKYYSNAHALMLNGSF